MHTDSAPSRLAQWFNSVRVRLAFWHAVTLAVLLGTFAVGAYIFLFQSARELVDRSLVETSHMFVATWHDEQDEEHSTPEFAAREAAREVRYLDRGVLLYDSTDRLVAISDQAKLSGALPLSRLARVANQPLAQLVARSELDGPAFQTIGRGDTSIRARAERIVYEGAPYTLVVLQELGQAEDGRKTFATWVIATLPLVILLAGLGGYLLARASRKRSSTICVRRRPSALTTRSVSLNSSTLCPS